MRGRWLLISVAAVAAGVGGGALSWHFRNGAATLMHKAGAALIKTGSIVTITGKIHPQHITTVAPDTDGDLESFQVEIGEDVFEGEVLAHIGASTLESAIDSAQEVETDAQAKVAKAEAAAANARMESSRADADLQRATTALAVARAAYERQQNLLKLGAASKQAHDKAQRDYEDAQRDYETADKAARLSADQLQVTLNVLSAAQKLLTDATEDLAAARDNLESAEVRSPVDGLVVDRHGEPGKPAGNDLFEIATDMYALEVAIEPKPEVLQRIQPGQQALVLILDLQSAGIPGQVAKIQGNQVMVDFNSTLPAIRPGMTADVRLKLE